MGLGKQGYTAELWLSRVYSWEAEKTSTDVQKSVHYVDMIR